MGNSSRNWDEGAPAEPDLSWMSFAPEAHGLKPALCVWPTRNSLDGDASPLLQQHGLGSSPSASFDDGVDELQEDGGWPKKRARDWRTTEQVRKGSEDLDADDYGGDDGDERFFGDSGASPSSSSFSAGVRRSPRPPDRGSQAQSPDSSKILHLQSALTVAVVAGVVALATSVFLLYLSFGATARPPSSCEADKVVLNFTAQRIRLRGGRYISFREQGVSADRARRSLLVVHDVISSRLAGIPGIKESLLKEFGVRLIAYDRPGYGQSDPHPGRSYNSSAQDMADIADALGLGEKFWVAGFGSGGPHVWAAINYIPERLAGVALFAPAGTFYAESMTKDEVAETWGPLTLRQKWMYSIARLFPALLPSLLQKTLFDHSPSPLRTMGGGTVGSKDQLLMKREDVLSFWERDVKEALQQQCAFPMAEELMMLMNKWGFSLANLPFTDEREVKSLLQQAVGLFQAKAKEKPRIFSGAIHIWQGSDDQHVPLAMNTYAKRMIHRNDFPQADPPVYLHGLEGEGHFSWFWFCDECHRTVLTSLFQIEDNVLGPYGRQVFSTEEYEAILVAFGGPKEVVDKLAKTKEAPVPSTKNVETTSGLLYKNADPEEGIPTGLKLYVPEKCDVPIDLSTFILRAIDERIRQYIR